MKPGDASNFVCTVTDYTGALVNSTVTGIVRLPDGTTVTLPIANPSTGVYTSSGYLWSQTGVATVRFTGTGTYPFVAETQVLIEALD